MTSTSICGRSEFALICQYLVIFKLQFSNNRSTDFEKVDSFGKNDSGTFLHDPVNGGQDGLLSSSVVEWCRVLHSSAIW